MPVYNTDMVITDNHFQLRWESNDSKVIQIRCINFPTDRLINISMLVGVSQIHIRTFSVYLKTKCPYLYTAACRGQFPLLLQVRHLQSAVSLCSS